MSGFQQITIISRITILSLGFRFKTQLEIFQTMNHLYQVRHAIRIDLWWLAFDELLFELDTHSGSDLLAGAQLALHLQSM